jgi:carbamoyltransferase
MQGAYLGPSFSQEEIETRLTAAGARFTVLGEAQLIDRTVEALIEGKAVGWFQGRMEFGPRALGARSILGDPRSPTMQSVLNLKVKYRESFRPFAPAVLEDHVDEYFDIDIPSPYMLIVMPVKPERRRNAGDNDTRAGLDKLKVARSDVPAVTHVDYSVRLQTVTRERNGFFHDVVAAFHRRTGCPMIVNTSFNLRGEPIVADHKDAYHAFLMSDLDIVVLGGCVVAKAGVELEPAGAAAELVGA